MAIDIVIEVSPATGDDALEASEHLGDVFEVPEIVRLSQSGVTSR